MHSSGKNKTRVERVKQVKEKDKSIYDFSTYIPISNAVIKMSEWSKQGCKIFYISFHGNKKKIKEDRLVLKKYGFPKGKILYRKGEKEYKDILEKESPDILIEDDCESIGGEKEMIITNISSEFKNKIKSIVVKEFEGIDELPDNIIELLN